MSTFSAEKVRAQFPFFSHHPNIAYLDNAATTQKPQVVIDSITHSYISANAPVARGLYSLAASADEHYANARSTLSKYFGAGNSTKCIFTSSATASINLVANSFVKSRLNKGDEIWLTPLEHHSNFLPWQRICASSGAVIKWIPMNPISGDIHWEKCDALFGQKSKFIAITALSNVTGAAIDIKLVCQRAAKASIPVLIDGAQLVAHHLVEFDKLDCDFFVCSAHKMFGPNGIGLLLAKTQRLEQMQPDILGGGMIDWLGHTFEDNQWSSLPRSFEPGSANLSGAIGFSAAAQYMNQLRQADVQDHIAYLGRHLLSELSNINGIRLLTAPENAKNGIISFFHDTVHPHDIAQVCADNQVAIRAGHHCAQPLFNRLSIQGAARASLTIYNTQRDIQILLTCVQRAIDEFAL